MFVSAFGILCGFALVAFAAASRPGRATFAFASVAAALVWILPPSRTLPDPVWGAFAVLTLAALLLWRPNASAIAATGAGAAAAVWLLLFVGQGVPWIAGLVIVGSIAGLVFVLRQRSPQFAPPRLVEEALLISTALAILVACWPAIEAGYQSATVFTAERVSVPVTTSAPWALQLSVGLLVIGGLYGYWTRR